MKAKILEVPWGARYASFKEGDIVEGFIDERNECFTATTIHYWMPGEFEIIKEDAE